MKFKVEIQFRDDSVEQFDCWEPPYITDWVILYLNDEARTRKVFPKEAIKSINYWLAV